MADRADRLPRDASDFHDLFGRAPDADASAPGRVNLIGEHTDYNGGLVLPIATPQTTTVQVGLREDRTVRVWSANTPRDVGPETYELGSEAAAGRWVDYVAGVTGSLARTGVELRGFDARIQSTVPLGAGLSSSAALEVALIRALAAALGLTLDPVAVARIAHAAETDWVGAPVGIMDQMAASLATPDAALFLDTRSLAFERLPLPDAATLVVIDSGITHSHAAGEYRVRRAECDDAAARLGVEYLSDASATAAASLPPPLDRRARHVLTENERVRRARVAFQDGDAAAFGALMNASHASMRDDFEVSLPAIDRLVLAAQAQADVFGARLTGGGFGGSIVVLVNGRDPRATARRIVEAYAGEPRPTVLIP